MILDYIFSTEGVISLFMWLLSWAGVSILSEGEGDMKIAWKLFTVSNILMIVFGIVGSHYFITLQGVTYLQSSLRGWVLCLSKFNPIRVNYLKLDNKLSINFRRTLAIFLLYKRKKS
jgi:hypothetical protein